MPAAHLRERRTMVMDERMGEKICAISAKVKKTKGKKIFSFFFSNLYTENKLSLKLTLLFTISF
jgi:hypothetical protein